MPSIIQADFSGGEVTPRIRSKIGSEKHFKSLAKAMNWMITPQGSAMTRQGTMFADHSLNVDRFKKLFVFPAKSARVNDVVIEIDSNGLLDVEHQGNIYAWDGVTRTTLTQNVPAEFGDLQYLRSAWDVSTNSLVLASKNHAPYRLHYDGVSFLLEPLYDVANQPVEWSELNGYPNALAFFQNRLWFAGTDAYPNGMWATVTGNIYDIIGTEALNLKPLLEGYIQWILASSRRLTIGTSMNEYSLDSTDGSGVTAANARIQRTSSHGSNDVQAEPVNEQVMFVSAGGAKLMGINYVRDEDNWLAQELSNPAQHMFRRPFSTIKKIVSSPNTDSTIFVLRFDGSVAACTYDRSARVNAWTLLDFGQRVIDLVSIKTIRGNFVYALVKRTNEEVVPDVTVMEILKPLREFWFRGDSYMLATYAEDENGQYATGLERFEGQLIDVASVFGTLASGVRVIDGRVTIHNMGPNTTLEIYAGLVIENVLVTLEPTMGQIKDSLVGSKIALTDTTLVAFDSVPPVVNGERHEDVLTSDHQSFRPLDFGYVSLRREDIRNDITQYTYDISGYEDVGVLTIEQTEPFICELIGIASQVTSNRT
jgi:hypothetical protein